LILFHFARKSIKFDELLDVISEGRIYFEFFLIF
jgi:hypothetical protein